MTCRLIAGQPAKMRRAQPPSAAKMRSPQFAQAPKACWSSGEIVAYWIVVSFDHGRGSDRIASRTMSSSGGMGGGDAGGKSPKL